MSNANSPMPSTPSTPHSIARARRRLGGKGSQSDSDSSSSSDSDSTVTEPGKNLNQDGQDDQDGCQEDADDIDSDEFSRVAWPLGPTKFDELFGWSDYHARILLSECEDASAHRDNVSNLLSVGLLHHDAYSGLGTASITAKQQMASLNMKLNKLRSQEGLMLCLFYSPCICADTSQFSSPHHHLCSFHW